METLDLRLPFISRFFIMLGWSSQGGRKAVRVTYCQLMGEEEILKVNKNLWDTLVLQRCIFIFKIHIFLGLERSRGWPVEHVVLLWKQLPTEL